MSANPDDPGKFDIMLLIGDMGVRAGIQVQQKLRKHHYPLIEVVE